MITQQELIIGNLTREDGLVNSRISWLMTAQGFLYASWGLVMGSSFENKIAASTVFAFLGIFLCLVAMVVIQISHRFIEDLKSRWKALEGDESGVTPFGIDIFGESSRFRYIGLSYMLPSGCVVAWVVLLFM